MKKQKLEKVTVFKDGKRISVLVAPVGIHPTIYSTCNYTRGNLSQKDTLRVLCREVMEEKFIPTEACKGISYENLLQTRLFVDEILSTYPDLEHICKDGFFPKDMENITNKYKREFYQIFGDYLAVLCFPKQFPFTEAQMYRFSKDRINALMDKISYLYDYDMTKLQKDNLGLRCAEILQEIGFLAENPKETLQDMIYSYWDYRIAKETDSDMIRFYKEMQEHLKIITVDNIDKVADLSEKLADYYVDKTEDEVYLNKN